MKLKMTVNDEPVSIDVAPNAFLADVLRKQLGLTGTKIGCQEAECGICTVLVTLPGGPAEPEVWIRVWQVAHQALIVCMLWVSVRPVSRYVCP